MIPTKLILIDGLPGSGKSTTAQFLASQLQKNNIKAEWFYETEPQDAHPVHVWDHHNVEELMNRTLQKWGSFASTASASDTITILDGSLFQCTIEEMLEDDVPKFEIECYFHRVAEVIKDLNPALIYLYQTDIATALRKTCDQRSPSWEAWFIEEITSRAYAKNRGLTGFEGLVTFYHAQRALTDQLFAKYSYPKLAIENSGDDWDAYRRQILDFLALPFVEDEPVSEKYLRRFVGTYKIVQGSPRRNIFEPFVVALEGQQLVVYDLWWPRSTLIPQAHNIFYIQSGPFEVIFEEDATGEIRTMKFGGKRLRDFSDRILTKIEEE